MRKFLRLVAIALLAATLPVQGLASVVAAQCMTAGHHEGAAPEGHAHADGDGSHDHGTAAQEIDDNDASAAHCGPCTACCASAFIAAPAAVFLVPPASYSQYFFSQFPPRGILPQALDRPPLAL